jgi:glycosyltransferase involved in cell wall biosynthesis
MHPEAVAHLSVLVVVGQLTEGGTERQVHELMTRLDRALVRPTVACASERAMPYAPRLEAAGVPVTLLRGSAASRARDLRRLLRAGDVEVVHSLGDPAGVITAVANAGVGVPHLHTERSAHSGLARRVARLVARTAADLVTTNTPGGDARYLPNGVDPVRFSQSSPPGARRVLFVGRETRTKGTDRLARVLSDIDRCEVALLGPGLERVARTIERAGHRITAARPVSDVERWYAWCDVLLSTSRSEGTPNAVLEAMASARAVVASAVGGSRHAVLDGVTGFLFPPADTSRAAGFVQRVLADRALADRMGRRGRARAESHYGLPRACASLVAAYRDVMRVTRG